MPGLFGPNILQSSDAFDDRLTRFMLQEVPDERGSTSYLLVNRLVLARILGEINVSSSHIKLPLFPFRLFVTVIS